MQVWLFKKIAIVYTSWQSTHNALVFANLAKSRSFHKCCNAEAIDLIKMKVVIKQKCARLWVQGGKSTAALSWQTESAVVCLVVGHFHCRPGKA